MTERETLLAKAVSLCEQGADLRTYSGRGMGEQSCVAVVFQSLNDFSSCVLRACRLAGTAQELARALDLFEEMLEEASVDKVANSTVIYWQDWEPSSSELGKA